MPSKPLDALKKLAEAQKAYNEAFDKANALALVDVRGYLNHKAGEAHEGANRLLDNMAEKAARTDFPTLAQYVAALEDVAEDVRYFAAQKYRNQESTCDGCLFAESERDVNWADRPEGYYTCALDKRERWGEDPKCPDTLWVRDPKTSLARLKELQ